MRFKLKKLSDMQKIPSVLDVKELNEYLDDLMEIIENSNKIEPLTAAESINDLIGYQGNNFEGISTSISKRIFSKKCRVDIFSIDFRPNCRKSIESRISIQN